MPPSLPPTRFIVPGIAGTPTGGNIYNARILKHWPESEPTARPETVTWPVDRPPADPIAGIPRECVIMVDSLCLQHARAIRGLRAKRPKARIVVLAHYLSCVDPRETETDAAAVERTLLPLLNGAITPSQFVRDGLLREGMTASSVMVAAPGLDARFHRHENRGDLSDPHADTPPVPQLLTVANVLPGKGLDVLLRALEQLTDHAWTWRLIGGTDLDPAYGDRFRRHLEASSVRERVRWAGTVDAADMPAAYDAADVFVLPTHFETCSMATREALARGCPVVASDVGGLPENFGDRDVGVLVPPNDAGALADVLGTLLSDPARRASLAREAIAQSQSFPLWETTAARCARLLHHV